MSNPYGGHDSGPPPDPFHPYEQPSGGSYLPNPYLGHGGNAPGGSSTDGISIAALVCSLTCCAAPVGVGLGIAGIVRTRNERRSGRWAAITGLVVGVFGTLALVAGGIGLFWVGTNVVFFEDALAGDCIDVGDRGDSLDVWKADCDEPHDAEVLHAGRFSEALVEDYRDDAYFCDELAEASGYGSVVQQGRHEIYPIVESYDVEDPEVGDWFLCVAEARDDDRLEAPLPRGEAAATRDDEDELPTRKSTLDLEAGDCFDETDPEEELVYDVLPRPCDEPHSLEVLGSVELKPGKFPGDAAIDRRTEDCLEVFEDYVGISYDDSRFELYWYTPTADSWRNNKDRSITCVGAHPRDKKLNRSLEDIRR